MADRVTIDLPSNFSDGDPATWETSSCIRKPGDTLYHDKIADMWMKHTNQAQPGTYIHYQNSRTVPNIHSLKLSRLPAGYAVHVKPRKGSSIVDRYILGHKNGRFDSPNRFFDHAQFLFSGGTGKCTCVNCTIPTRSTLKTSILKSFRSSVPRSDKAGLLAEEDDSDPSQKYFDAVKAARNSHGHHHFTSLPWTEKMPAYLNLNEALDFDTIAEAYRSANSFEPRKGELVLFYENFFPALKLDPLTQQLRIYDTAGTAPGTFPPWKVGVVAEIPERIPTIADLTMSMSVANRGEQEQPAQYLVELYRDTTSLRRSVASRVQSVDLSHIRPFNVAHEILTGQSQNSWHPSIKEAFKALNTVCFVAPKVTTGVWPRAHISCGGVWIGAELIILHDVVRLMPQESQEIIDTVMLIHDIRLEFDETLREGGTEAHLIGTLFSLSRSQRTRQTPLSHAELLGLPQSMQGYTWYPIKHSPDKSMFKAAPSTVVGRCYEQRAVVSMIAAEDLDFGLSLHRGRSWAMAHALLVTALKEGWRLANDRSEALNLEVLNGVAVGRGRQRQKLSGLIRGEENGGWGNKGIHEGTLQQSFDKAMQDKSSIFRDAELQDEREEEDQTFSIISDRTAPTTDDDDNSVKAFVQEAISKGIMLPRGGNEDESPDERWRDSHTERALKRSRI
ncbi:MAG: hypothetical protein M1818_001986 [Claussenomyces sp. TS43310]|nr:MAG: hypothetical protein M1818_001986 [Claussenomyces sp. TS43310]